MAQKYFVGRRWIISGREEFQMQKRFSVATDFCDIEYLKKFPNHVWQFSKLGAKNIVERLNDTEECDKLLEYFMIPVESVLDIEAETDYRPSIQTSPELKNAQETTNIKTRRPKQNDAR